MSRIITDRPPSGMSPKISRPLFVLLCFGASLAGGVITFCVALVIVGIVDSVLSRDRIGNEALIIVILAVLGMILPVVILRRNRARYRQPRIHEKLVLSHPITQSHPSAGQSANSLNDEDLNCATTDLRVGTDSMMPATTVPQPTSVPPIGNKAEPKHKELPKRDYDRYSVLSLSAMGCFAGFVALSCLVIWTTAGQSDALKTAAIVGTPAALAGWAFYVVNALHESICTFGSCHRLRRQSVWLSCC